jgi:hypothetical protein
VTVIVEVPVEFAFMGEGETGREGDTVKLAGGLTVRLTATEFASVPSVPLTVIVYDARGTFDATMI